MVICAGDVVEQTRSGGKQQVRGVGTNIRGEELFLDLEEEDVGGTASPLLWYKVSV